ncbi:hypothetical protein [Bacillus benzoevorans]|uniref:Uncharacterized protein (UPF0305 family) n=1 Tax=Bacillus benzoevorans TaxID=1456 RepID=A0A7X0HY73_9BACI|nr:hypothetical protein [Bacillus benzoevorans]MBB6447785.1 uncharacterized protein (UPF0305 family) [Bacillus benzoevorans]
MNTKFPNKNVELDLAVHHLHLAVKQLEKASKYIHHHNSNVKLNNIHKMITNLLTQIESDELKYYRKVRKGNKQTKIMLEEERFRTNDNPNAAGTNKRGLLYRTW